MSNNPKSRAKGMSAASSLPSLPDLRQPKHQAKTYSAITTSQETYINKIADHTLTFCIGPAGTGKTFCAAIAAAGALRAKEVDKIIITRPLVEAGEKLGFLPGDMNEKVHPYVAPFVEALSRIMGTGNVEALIDNQRIVFLPLAFMRGHSWNDTFVVLDEAQNVTKSQMKLFLTRIGKGTKVIVDGDISQKDIDAYGLDDAIERLARVKRVAVHEFTNADIVRSGIVRDIIKAYSNLGDYEESEDNREGLNTFLDNT
jgi:phosphate starvation-inducible PhoH-like protein